MIRTIVIHPDPVLRQVAEPVERIDADLIADMLETMYDAPGRGLAAPQLGVLRRLFVMDVDWKDGPRRPQVFVNPEIMAESGRQVNTGGCLSIPDTPRRVARPERIELRWRDETGAARAGAFEGFAAACVCHEIDHLDGRLILDHPEADGPGA